MARIKPSAAQSRRAAARAAARRERQIVLAVAATLLVVAAIVAGGFYFTVIRAPRVHVLTVDGRSWNATQVAHRAAYLTQYENGAVAYAGALPERAVELLTEEQLLRDRAPAAVGEVTADQIEAGVRAEFGFPDPVTASDPDATRASYRKNLDVILNVANMSQEEYDDVVRARVLRQRLREHVQSGAAATVAQVRLARIRVADQATADSLRQQALGGADFAALADQHKVDAGAPAGGALGWVAPETVDASIAQAIAGLAPGALSAVVAANGYYDVYRVEERDPARAVTDAQRRALADRWYTDWLTQQRAQARIVQDLSSGESRWINEHVGSHFRDVARNARSTSR